ncbi:MAG: glycosyltransferase family 4 protein [Bacteroidetes bacterium]|jgi:mannosyltransferase|nr:glycosyltransferase family 4 protein [Bacteroidota bacterium]
MSTKPILIHTHFHKRRTGVTRSIENVLPFFEKEYETYIYGFNVAGKKISLSELFKLVFTKKYFVMHCHRNNEMLRALFFKLIGGNFKMVSSRHAETKPSSLTKFLLKKSDAVVALTLNMAKDLPFHSVVIGHGVDVDLFKPKADSNLDFIIQKNIIVCAGRVRAAKGQKVLVEALAPILKQHPQWALLVVGKVDKPEFIKELKAIVRQYDVMNQVYFKDETPAIVEIYQAAHTAVIPSYTEGFSLVCAEAMACGCNVVATENVGIHSDLIQHSKNGYLFEAGNTKLLQGLLQEIMQNKLPHLGNVALKEIETKWSAKHEAQKLMELYNN